MESQQSAADTCYTVHPIVLCHGLFGFSSMKFGPATIAYWQGIEDALRERGAVVLTVEVPATSTPEERANNLERKISMAFSGRSVHLVGESLCLTLLTEDLRSLNFHRRT
jgi:hypothetical protein